MSNALDLQKSVRAVLVADTTIAGLVGARIYDEPPQDPTFPYIRFGEIMERPMDTDSEQAASITMDVEAYSRPKAGRVECQKIIDAIRAALHRKESAVELDGAGEVTLCVAREHRVIRTPDGRTYFGLIIFDWIVDGGR